MRMSNTPPPTAKVGGGTFGFPHDPTLTRPLDTLSPTADLYPYLFRWTLWVLANTEREGVRAGSHFAKCAEAIRESGEKRYSLD
jgi:hypothetical protein